MTFSRTSTIASAVIAGAMTLFATSALAQYPSLRLVPKEAKPSEGNGYTKNSAAAGYGKVALGSPDALNLGSVATGAVYIWDVKTAAQGKTVYPPAADAVANMDFGAAVAISGKHLVVGAPGAGTGAVYIFDVNTGALLKKVTFASSVAGDGFGSAVALDRDQLVIGAPFDDDNGADAGNVIVHNMLTSTNITAKPVGATTALAAGANYGSSVAIRNGVILVGAPGAEIAHLVDAGSADSWLAELEDPAGAAGDRFGESVCFMGQLDIGVSSPLADDGALVDCGAVTRFEISEVVLPVLITTDYGLTNGDKFGSSLAGAPYQLYAGMSSFDAGLVDTGAVAPLGAPTLSPAGSVAGDQLGASVAYADAVVVTSAPGDDTKGANAGALWMFKGPRALTIGFPSNPTYILKGDTATGAGQTTFSSFTGISVPQSDDFDLPAYTAKIAGIDSSGGRTSGIWGWNPANVSALNLALTGTADLAANSLLAMVNNVTDTTWFRSKRITNGKIVLAYNLDGTLTIPVEVGVALGGKTVSKISDGRADNVSQPVGPGLYSVPLTFSGLAKTADTGIWTSDGTEVQEGQNVTFNTETGTANFTYGQMPTRLALSGSASIFAAPILTGTGPVVTTANNAAVFSGTNLLLRKGSPAPGTTGTFSTFLGETLDSTSGVSLVRATIAGAGITSANNEGLWTDRNTSPSFTLLLRKGLQAPGMAAGVTIKKIVHYYITTFGDVVVLAAVGGTGITAANDQVLYYNRAPGLAVNEPGTFEVLLQEGNRIPGVDNAKVGTISTADYTTRTDNVADSSYYGVLVTLVNETGGATKTNNLAWLVGDLTLGSETQPSLRLPQLMLRKGLVAEAPAGKQIVSSMTFITKPNDKSGAGNTGLPHIISAGARSSSLIVTYPDKSQGIMTLLNPAETP
jgi:hypothetical protein